MSVQSLVTFENGLTKATLGLNARMFTVHVRFQLQHARKVTASACRTAELTTGSGLRELVAVFVVVVVAVQSAAVVDIVVVVDAVHGSGVRSFGLIGGRHRWQLIDFAFAMVVVVTVLIIIVVVDVVVNIGVGVRAAIRIAAARITVRIEGAAAAATAQMMLAADTTITVGGVVMLQQLIQMQLLLLQLLRLLLMRMTDSVVAAVVVVVEPVGVHRRCGCRCSSCGCHRRQRNVAALLMGANVPMHVAVGGERQVAVFAVERPFASVDEHVPIERRGG